MVPAVNRSPPNPIVLPADRSLKTTSATSFTPVLPWLILTCAVPVPDLTRLLTSPTVAEENVTAASDAKLLASTN